MNKKLFLIAALSIIIISSTIPESLAQTNSTDYTESLPDSFSGMYHVGMIFLTFIAASIGRVILVWQHKKRTIGEAFNYKKFGKGILAGVILGAFVAGYLVLTDEHITDIHIVTFKDLINKIIWAFPILISTIFILEKLFPDFVGRLQKVSGTYDNTIPANTDRTKT